MDHPTADDVADAVGFQFAAGEHPDHTRHGPSLGDIYALDIRVRVRAAYEHRMPHAGQHHVVDITTRPGYEPLVLFARNACANSFDTHRLLLQKWTDANPWRRWLGGCCEPLSSGAAGHVRRPALLFTLQPATCPSA